MASESTSSQQSQQLTPSSKVNFKCEDGIITFNNAVALLEHPNELYRPMLNFLSNYCINEATKPITFSLSWCDKFLIFTQDEFISAIGLPICKDVVPLPPKETIKAGLATLGLIEKDKPTLSSTILTEQSLIPPFGEVNDDDTADKFLSRAFVQPVTQPKAPTNLKTKKKRIPPSSKPESPYKVRVILAKKPVIETQHDEVTVATIDATKSQVASELAEDQGNQPSATDAKKVQDQKIQEVKESELDPMEDVTFDQIMDEIDQRNKDAEKAERSQRSVLDDHDVINITPKDDEGDTYDSGLCFMPDDDLTSLTAQSDPLGHLHEELYLLNNKVNQLESNITKQVSVSIQSSVPLIVVDILKERMFGLLSDALKDTLPQLIKDSSKIMFRNPLQRIYLRLRHRFDNLQEQLSKVIKTNLDKSIRLEVQKGMKEVQDKLSFWEQSSAQVIPNAEQAPPVNEEKALVLHTLEEKSLGEKDTDDEPPAKKLKFIILTSSAIPSPTPLKSIMHKLLQKHDANKMTMDQFTEHLTNTTSSIFSPSPPREPTPPRDEQKGKGIATEDPLKEIMPFMEEGADLKVEKEKSEKSLKKILNPATIKAQTQKMVEHEAKRKKMFDEYNHQITHRADQLLITKISYKINSSKEPTMRITRANDPLNLTVHERFRLKTLGFSEWLEVHSLASKTQMVDGMKRNLAPPPGVEGRKGLVIKEPEEGILQGLIIRDTPEAEEVYNLMKLEIKSRDDVTKAREILSIEEPLSGGLKGNEVQAECKASAGSERTL
ncbi:hypothetical protein Tco_1263474 [Tanacetum coccineum]